MPRSPRSLQNPMGLAGREVQQLLTSRIRGGPESLDRYRPDLRWCPAVNSPLQLTNADLWLQACYSPDLPLIGPSQRQPVDAR